MARPFSPIETLATMYGMVRKNSYTTIPLHSWEKDVPLQQLAQIGLAHREARASITADRGLNIYGRQQRYRQIDEKLRADVDAWRQAHVETLKTRAHNIKLQLIPKSEPAADPVVAARHNLILQSIGNPEPIVAEVLYLNGNAETRAAMRAAPQRVSKSGMVFTSLVPESVIVKAALDEAPADVMDQAGDFEALAGDYSLLAGSLLTYLNQQPGAAAEGDPQPLDKKPQPDPKGSEIIFVDSGPALPDDFQSADNA